MKEERCRTRYLSCWIAAKSMDHRTDLAWDVQGGRSCTVLVRPARGAR